MSKHVVDGTRDRCRNCQQIIEWNSYEVPSYYREGETMKRHQWQHRLPEGGSQQECDAEVRASPEAVRFRELHYGAEFSRYAEPISFCTVHQESYSYSGRNICHRRVKDGKLLRCGIHARPIREQQMKEKRRQDESEMNSFMRKGIEKQIEHLKVLGLESAAVHVRQSATSGWPGYRTEITGNIICDPEELIALLEEERF